MAPVVYGRGKPDACLLASSNVLTPMHVTVGESYGS
jgi:hypothetical protein